MIKVNTAIKPPQFRFEDNNRIWFNSTAEKTSWINKTFDTTDEKELKNFVLNDITSFTIKIPFDNLNKGLNSTYCYIVIDGVYYYYFMDNSVIVKGNTDKSIYLLQFNCKLDIFTTYFDKLSHDFGGSVMVRRTHQDRWKYDNLINISPDNSSWNNEPDIAALPTVNREIIPFSFSDTEKEFEIKQYRDFFGTNSHNRTLLYGVFTPNMLNVPRIFNNGFGSIPSPDLITPIRIANGAQDYLSVTFDTGNSYNSPIIESGILGSIRILNLPIEKVWDNVASLRWITFKGSELGIIHENANHQDTINKIETHAHRNTGAIYKITAPNPMHVKRIEGNKFNPLNEPKLYTSQFMNISLLCYNGEKKNILNEYLNNDNELLDIDFNETIHATDTGAHFLFNDIMTSRSAYYDRLLSFLIRDELPTLSSGYADYIRGHLNSVKMGIQANQVNSMAAAGWGVTSALALDAPVAAAQIGKSIQTGVAGIMQEGIYRAQIKDAKNAPDSEKGIASSILSDWTNLYRHVTNDSVINYGIQIKELSEIDKYNVAMHLNKFGYETNKVMYLTNNSFMTRKRFTYWEIADPENMFRKGELPPAVLSEFAYKFKGGVRLWAVDTDINNYELENWETYV